MLTESKFKEFYGEAERLRALGGAAAAGEILLFLFDNGQNVGGYGVVRLSFVLRDLAALADLANPRPEPDAQRIRRALERRRDERERQATLGEAGFTELQELVALNRSLNEPQRTVELFQSFGSEADDGDRAEVRRALGQLIAESTFPEDAEKIALQLEGERIKRKLVDLERAIDVQLARPDPDPEAIDLVVVELRTVCGRYRAVQVADLPRGQLDLREVARLAQDTLALLDRHLVPGSESDAEGFKLLLWRLSRDLPALFESHQIRPELLRDASLRLQLIRQARDTAARIADCRISEDLPFPDAALPIEHREALEARILHDGLIAYEAFLRIEEETLAERMAAWLLSFRQNEEMYSRLAMAAGRARKPSLERRLREQAQRLSRR